MTAARTLPIRQNTPEWEEARRSTIGSSDIAIIAGESPYKSAYTLAAEKLGLIPQAIDESTRRLMDIGHLLQPALLRLYELETGRHPKAAPAWRQHPELPWATASLDGTAPTRRVVEAKWSHSARWRNAERVPGDVFAQVQWQLFITGWPVADVIVLDHTSPRVEEVPRDEVAIADLRWLAEDFHAALQRGELPPIDGSASTAATQRARWPGDTGEVLDATPELEELGRRLAAARQALRDAENLERTTANALREALGPAAGVAGLLTYRQNAPSSAIEWPKVAHDYRELLEASRPLDELDAIVARYTTTTPGARQLRITKRQSEPDH